MFASIIYNNPIPVRYKEQLLLVEAKADALETQLLRANQNAFKSSEREEEANKIVEKLESCLKEKEANYESKLGEFTR